MEKKNAVYTITEDQSPEAYFLGAGAYFAEILVLTDGFRQKVPRKELFMAYCFGPLYILLGLSYLLEA